MWLLFRRSCMVCVVHALLPASASRRATGMTAGFLTVLCPVTFITSKKQLTQDAQSSSAKKGTSHCSGGDIRATGDDGQSTTKHSVDRRAISGMGHTVVDVSSGKCSDAFGSQMVDSNEALLEAVNRVRDVLQRCQGTHNSPDTTSSLQSPPLTPFLAQQEKELEGREEMLTAIAALLEKDTTFGPRFLSSLSGDALRSLLVIGTTQEYFGQDAVEAQLRAVDKDQDDNISSQDYDAWVNTAVRERVAMRFELPRATAHVHDTTTSKASILPNTTAAAAGYIPWGLWHRIALSSAVPFMAFGMLDNTIFITAGDAIDKRFAEAFGMSTMAAAALGGVVSGTAGIQMHGLAERMAQRSRLARPPTLTPSQSASASNGSATRVGSTLGMILGLLFGMTPLLLLSVPVSRSEREQPAKG
ncbi:hypothetical protein ECC02_000672 [Trypanosoma cruzi]|uniref:EF-hand domain-containing protein n=1 Tax=Trypanosoma cruzi TaxID=5693 RepID=A0A7J6YH71_TRYCR|nr:hypothetical protein ECC02_000672 [Trypanosoma cruzi]